MSFQDNIVGGKPVLRTLLGHYSLGQKKLIPIGRSIIEAVSQLGQDMAQRISTPGSFSDIYVLSARESLAGIF